MWQESFSNRNLQNLVNKNFTIIITYKVCIWTNFIISSFKLHFFISLFKIDIRAVKTRSPNDICLILSVLKYLFPNEFQNWILAWHAMSFSSYHLLAVCGFTSSTLKLLIFRPRKPNQPLSFLTKILNI